MPVIRHGDLSVDFIEAGSGPTVVLAHSSVSGNRQWKRLIELLSVRYRVLAPNLYGYGQTTAWTADGTQTFEDAAEVIFAVCELAAGPLRMVGHSWGASVAMAAAHKLGARVTHLALFEPMLPSLLREHGATEAWAEAHALYADVKRLGGNAEWEALAKRFTDFFNGDGVWETMPAERQRAVAGLLPPNYFEWDSATKPTRVESFTGIAARTLLMRSADTRLVLYAAAELLRQAYPQWAFTEFPDGGHMAPMTRAAAVNETIVRFLDTD
jgi:pimeloyl-ACP methyl ester carboxylesterase